MLSRAQGILKRLLRARLNRSKRFKISTYYVRGSKELFPYFWGAVFGVTGGGGGEVAGESVGGAARLAWSIAVIPD
jgi:hypothetical protein